MIEKVIEIIQPRLLHLKRNKLLAKIPEEQREKISYLLENQKIGRESIGKQPNGRQEYSNCYGATIYNFENEEIRRRCQDISEEIGENSLGYIQYIKSDKGPSFIGSISFIQILEEFFEKVDEPVEGNVISLWPLYSRNGRYPVHAGIWTGIDETFFEQRNIRGRFQFNYLDNKKRKKLDIEFHKLRRKL